MSAYPEIGRWKFYSAKDDGWSHYQGKDTPPEGQWVIPCDDEAIGRAVDALMADYGLDRFGSYRAMIERRLRVAFKAAEARP